MISQSPAPAFSSCLLTSRLCPLTSQQPQGPTAPHRCREHALCHRGCKWQVLHFPYLLSLFCSFSFRSVCFKLVEPAFFFSLLFVPNNEISALSLENSKPSLTTGKRNLSKIRKILLPQQLQKHTHSSESKASSDKR